MRREAWGLGLGGILAACSGAQTDAPSSPEEPRKDASEPETSGSERRSAPYTPDWSMAGYRGGKALPALASSTHKAADFGAIANDGKDDTAALRQALAELEKVSGPVVLELGEGTLDVSEILYVRRSDFVLRGAGSERTTLRFSRPLREMKTPGRIEALRSYLRANDKKVDGRWFSEFSWTGGVIWSRLPTGDQIAFDGPGPLLGPSAPLVTGRRGEREVLVEAAHDISVGETLVVRWFNSEGEDSELIRHVLGLSGSGFGARLADDPTRVLVEQAVVVEKVEGEKVTLEQGLLHDARAEWKARVGRVERLTEVGFSGFSIEFPDVSFGGHHQEAGYNGLHLNDLRNSWVTDVHIKNADSGILSDRSDRLTLQKVRVSGRPGHYGVHLGSVNAVLVEDFEVAPEFAHSVSFNTRCTGSVFTQGTITDGSLDQHRGFNHQNLYDSIIAIESDDHSRLFDHGGARYWGPPHGAFNTFYNVEVRFSSGSDEPVAVGSVHGAGPAWLINVRGNRPLEFDYEGAQIGEDSERDSLLQAQRLARAQRLAQAHKEK